MAKSESLVLVPMATPEQAPIEEKQSLPPSDSEQKREPEDAKYVEVQNTELALALASGPKLKATSARSIQLFAILLVAFMGSLSNGFDGSGIAFSPISAMITSSNNSSSYERCQRHGVRFKFPISLNFLILTKVARQYLDYFGINSQDSGGGVGTTTAIIFAIVCTQAISPSTANIDQRMPYKV